MMKIALITGASSGLGREFARQIPKLYQNLDEIWVVARRAERLNELEMELKVPVRIFDGDLNQDYIYKKLGIALGKSHANVRMLVNAAGYGKIGTFCEYGWKAETGMVDLNCRSLTRMTALCLPYMHCGSRIVNTAWICSVFSNKSLRLQPVHGTWQRTQRKRYLCDCSVSGTGGYRIL